MAAAKVTKKAATTTTKAATAKTAGTKKPVVKKKAPAVKQEPKKEEVVEEKKKLSWKQKLAIAGTAIVGIAGAIALHGKSKYNEGAADQAATDIQAYSQKPTEVNVYLTDNTTTEEPEIEELNDEAADEIEEI